jgi:diguanylate cyclase (GGDEF)-like protein
MPIAVTVAPAKPALSRRALPLLAALFALFVAMPWVVRPLEAWLPPATAALVGQAADITLGVVFVLWVLVLLRRVQRLSQRHALELGEVALTDPLTGLGTLRAFIHDLDLAVNRARRTREPVTVLFLDVDGFARLKARYGRAVGEHTLRMMGAVLRSSARFGSDMGYRVGEDEFAMVLAAERSGAETVGRRIEWNFRERSPRHSHLSMGITAWDGRSNPHAMLEQASRAMQASRQTALAAQMA